MAIRYVIVILLVLVTSSAHAQVDSAVSVREDGRPIVVRFIAPTPQSQEWFESPWFVAILAGVIGLAGSWIGTAATRKTTREQTKASMAISDKQLEAQAKNMLMQARVSIIPVQRQAWITSLRDALSEFIATSAIIHNSISAGGANAKGGLTVKLERVMHLSIFIRLMVTGHSNDEEELKSKLVSVGQQASTDPSTLTNPMAFIQQFHADVSEVERLASLIFRTEWLRLVEEVEGNNA